MWAHHPEEACKQGLRREEGRCDGCGYSGRKSSAIGTKGGTSKLESWRCMVEDLSLMISISKVLELGIGSYNLTRSSTALLWHAMKRKIERKRARS
jgi:hypothetical protein